MKHKIITIGSDHDRRHHPYEYPCYRSAIEQLKAKLKARKFSLEDLTNGIHSSTKS